MASEGRDLESRPRRGRRFVRAALWLAAGFIVWNVVFDREVRLAERRYVESQGHDAAASIREFMDPAIHRGVVIATGWAAAAAGAVAASDVLVRRRVRKRRPAGTTGASEVG